MHNEASSETCNTRDLHLCTHNSSSEMLIAIGRLRIIVQLVLVNSLAAVVRPMNLNMQQSFISTPLASQPPVTDENSLAMILLNAPLQSTPLFHRLWKTAKFHICADGAANRLRSLNQQANVSYVPNLIIGDLDSITEATREYYESVRTVQIIDQDRNDLDKALEAAKDFARVIVFGAFGGRFDQQMASLQALYCYPDRQIFLYNDTSMAVLVHAGQTSIYVALEPTDDGVSEGPTCGLIPLGQPARSMTTTGLQWNLNQQSSQFGGLVSTSNEIIDKVVMIDTTDPIVFTTEMHCGCSTLWSETS